MPLLDIVCPSTLSPSNLSPVSSILHFSSLSTFQAQAFSWPESDESAREGKSSGLAQSEEKEAYSNCNDRDVTLAICVFLVYQTFREKIFF